MDGRRYLSVLGLAASLSLCAWPLQAEPPYGPYAAQVVRLIDGDTVELDVALWPGLAQRIRLRQDGVNTPETKGVPFCEKILARRANEFTLRFFQLGGTILVSGVRLGEYAGRVLGRIAVGGRDPALAAGASLGAEREAAPTARNPRGSWSCMESILLYVTYFWMAVIGLGIAAVCFWIALLVVGIPLYIAVFPVFLLLYGMEYLFIEEAIRFDMRLGQQTGATAAWQKGALWLFWGLVFLAHAYRDIGSVIFKWNLALPPEKDLQRLLAQFEPKPRPPPGPVLSDFAPRIPFRPHQVTRSGNR